MVSCLKCKMNILIVGVHHGHGWTTCPECQTKQYFVGDRTFDESRVTIDHNTKEIRIK